MRFILLSFILIVSACGFTPVYAPSAESGTPSAAALADIDIAVIPDREGQVVRNYLLDRLSLKGQTANPSYRLIVSPISESTIEIGINKDDTASRAQLRQTAMIQLYDIQNDTVALKRSVHSVTSYNILAGQYTSLVTERDARDQALRALADNIVTELEIYFQR